MAHAITQTGVSVDDGRLGFLARLRKSLADFRLYRKTLVELESLSDRDLNDLGISRLVVRDIARSAVYKD